MVLLIILLLIAVSLLTLSICMICLPFSPRLHVVTVITDPLNENFLRLVNSALVRGIHVTPLVSRQKIGHGKGFGMKIKMLSDYIRGKKDTDIVMFVDGYDVLVTGAEKEIIEAYISFRRRYGDKAVFSAEYYCWPDGYKAQKYPEVKDSPYKYLNSGTYISSVGTLKRILKKTNIDIHSEDFEKFDDQRFYTDLYLQNQNLIVLDNYNKIFNCLAGATKDLEFRKGRWYNIQTKSYPLVYHGNGGPEIKAFLFDKIYPTI